MCSGRRPTCSNSFATRSRFSRPAARSWTQRFADDIARGHPRIEGSERVLKHDLHRTSERTQLALAETSDVGAIDVDPAACRLDQSQHAARDRRLAASGFAGQAENLADAKRKAHAIDRVHGADLAAQDAAAHAHPKVRCRQRAIRDDIAPAKVRPGRMLLSLHGAWLQSCGCRDRLPATIARAGRGGNRPSCRVHWQFG
jgi:hypothetical protein